MAILHADIGPRQFTRAEAAFEWRDEMGGWVFCPDAHEEHGFVWFPMSFTPKPIMRHRFVAGLSGLVTTSLAEWGAYAERRAAAPA